jgi:hypothetical protein
VKLPPDGIEVGPLPEPDPTLTTAQRFEMHERDPACAICHKKIDPIGLAFEHYDPIGMYRASEGPNELPIKTGGELLIDSQLDGAFEGATDLVYRLAATENLHNCVPVQMHRFALGREEVPQVDGCALGTLQSRFQNTNFNVRELILDVVTAETFLYRPATPAEASGS